MSIDNIRVESLSLAYGKSVVVRNATFSLPSSSITCIFGRNGSGKTTLLKGLSSLLRPNEGAVYIQGQNISDLSAPERAKLISTVFTNRPRIENMRVSDFIGFGRYPYTNWLGVKAEQDGIKVLEAIQHCGIAALSNRYLDELSDGEMQKVQLARVLAQDTPLLLLDEVASHLDHVNKAEIFSLLKKICVSARKTILFTSHDLQFAMQLADSFVVIQNGEVVFMSAADFKKNKIYSQVLKSNLFDFDPETYALRFNS